MNAKKYSKELMSAEQDVRNALDDCVTDDSLAALHRVEMAFDVYVTAVKSLVQQEPEDE